MKKNKVHILRFSLVISLLVFLAVLCFYNNFIIDYCSRIFVKAESFSQTEIKDDNVYQIKEKIVNKSYGEGTNALTITKIEAENKEYDGSTLVNLNVTVSGVLDGHDVKVSATGNTLNANADTKKYVNVENFIITGNNASEYYLANTNHNDVYVNISKKQVDLVWETDVNAMEYKYNGSNQLSTIKAYFVDKGITYNLPFTISGYSLYNGQNYYGEFINAGEYVAKIIYTADALNYEIKDNDITDGIDSLKLKINRVNPEINFQGSNIFTYNGKEQDISAFFGINNDEQIMSFSGNKFTSVSEGNNLETVVSVKESLNFFAYTKTFVKPINVLRATANIDIEGVNKFYTYTGLKQSVNYGATIDNTEQSLYYDKNEFTTVEEGNSLNIVVFAPATENYNYTSKTFKINVAKKKINTLNWEWGPSSLPYNKSSQSIVVRNYDKSLVTAYYTDNVATNVGIYCAKVSFVLSDPDNYENVNFPDKIWKITKKSILKPSIDNITTIYTGKSQTYTFKADNCICFNNVHTNAGTYKVMIGLEDALNYEWLDGTIDNVTINWTIEKQVVSFSEFDDSLVYNGSSLQPVIENPLYTLLENKQTEIGEYVSYIVLNDANNYKWENTDDNYIKITWHIVSDENYSVSTPIIAIIFAILLVLLLAVYLTLHFTIVIRKRRKRRTSSSNKKVEIENVAEVKESNTKDESRLSSSNVQVKADVKIEAKKKEISKPNVKLEETKKESKNKIEVEKTSTVEKERKKRMLSMKKVDKKKRRSALIKKTNLATKKANKKQVTASKKSTTSKKNNANSKKTTKSSNKI